MGLVDALISEIFANFKHSLHSSNQQSLQKQLRSDSHKKIHFMVIMISDKRFLNTPKYTAIAPPHEGERVGVSTSTYSRLFSSYLRADIIADLIFIISSECGFVIRSMCLFR